MSGDTFPKSGVEAVLLELARAKEERLKWHEQQWRNGGRTENQIVHLKSLLSHAKCWDQHEMFNNWKSMMARCYNKNHMAFARYGGAGVTVWKPWHFFPQLVADMGPKPEGKSLDRWPNRKGNYEPGNVRWATNREQVHNSSNPVFIEFNGKTQCVQDWSKELGIGNTTLFWRLKRGWPLDRVFANNYDPANP